MQCRVLTVGDDQCNTGNAYANFPSDYNLEGDNKYERGQESYRLFSGATKSHIFKAREYEVFKVIYA
jgi:hypothetical protein